MKVLPGVISIEGVIAAGKSTVLHKLETEYSCHVFYENVKDWSKWLDMFYRNMEKNSLGLQIQVLLSQYKWRKEIEEANGNNETPFIVERTPLTNNFIFGDALRDSGFLNETEYKLCMDLSDEIGWIPEKIIYLQCDTDTCFQRMLKRARPEERNMSRQYIDDLVKAHNNLYVTQVEMEDSKFSNTEVVVIDANRPLEDIMTDVVSYIQQWKF